MTKSRNLISPKVIWTDQMVEVLRNQYPDRRALDIAALLGISLQSVYHKAKCLGLSKSAEFNASPLSGRTDGKRGADTRFQPGFTSWNKGKAIGTQGNSAKTQFKKGAAPANQLPVGFIRVNTDGYKDIKVAPGPGNWVQLHHHNWKLAHGEYPPDGMLLIFKDGNKLNCDLENLELISRGDLMKRNCIHNLYPELFEVVQLRAALVRKINNRSKNDR